MLADDTVRSGAIHGLSNGYCTVRGRIDPKTGAAGSTKWSCGEISIVTFPLLACARVEAWTVPRMHRRRPGDVASALERQRQREADDDADADRAAARRHAPVEEVARHRDEGFVDVASEQNERRRESGKQHDRERDPEPRASPFAGAHRDPRRARA